MLHPFRSRLQVNLVLAGLMIAVFFPPSPMFSWNNDTIAPQVLLKNFQILKGELESCMKQMEQRLEGWAAEKGEGTRTVLKGDIGAVKSETQWVVMAMKQLHKNLERLEVVRRKGRKVATTRQ